MADKVYPSAKPAVSNGGSAAVINGGGGNPAFPPNKAQLYNTTRPVYRPQPPPRKHRRGCCCSCCLWTTFFIIILVFLLAAAGAALWVIYRPHRPNFSVTNLQLSQFNLSSTNRLNSKFNFTLTARNPNKKIVFFYGPISISINSNGVDVGDGSLPGFVHGTKNTTTVKTVISSSGRNLESTDVSAIRPDLKNKKGLPLKIKLDTNVNVKIGSLKTKKVGIRVTCDGIKLAVPTGKTATTATTSKVKCKANVRIKIWKWTF